MQPVPKLMASGQKIIINADDFGYSAEVNTAILRSFEQILITSASMLANMPGFDDAVRMVYTHKFFPKRIGLHLNLTEGYPLTGAIRKCRRFCDNNGRFIYDRRRPLYFFSRSERKAVYEEMKAQMDRIISAGIQPTHIDAHHHIHRHWGIAKLIARLGRKYDMRKIRLTDNLLFNLYLKKLAGISTTDYFGDINDLVSLMKKGPFNGRSIEIMVHPSQHPLLSGIA